MRIRSIVSIIFHLVRLLFSLLLIWLTTKWKIRKTRKAFERELIRQGIREEDAKKLRSHYSQLANTAMNAFKQKIMKNFQRN